MKLSNALNLGFAASFLFTVYSGVQSIRYYHKLAYDEGYVNAKRFEDISMLVNNAETFMIAKSPDISKEMLSRAEQKLGDVSVIDDFMREVNSSLSESDCDYEYQASKLEMVQDELDSVRKSYLSHSKTSENYATLSKNWRNFMYSLILSSLIALGISIYSAKKPNS